MCAYIITKGVKKMQKIIITNCNKVEKPGKTPFWACESNNGSKYTVWDENLANLISQNLNRECEAEVKQSGNFWNIRGFVVGSNSTLPTVNNNTSNITVEQTDLSFRDKNILSQMITKAAVVLVANDKASGATTGEQLADAINEITGGLNLARHNVETLKF